MTNDEFKRKRLVDSMKTKDEDSNKRARFEDVLSKEKQFEHFKRLRNVATKENDKCYLLSLAWYRSFKQYCEGTTDTVSPIDNSSLLDDDEESKLRRNLIYEKDYIFLPEKAWKCLVNWYGIKEDRFIISQMARYFEVYQLHEKSSKSRSFYLHHQSTIHDFYKALVIALKITTPVVHVWLLNQRIRNEVFVTESLLNSLSMKEIDPLALSAESYLSDHLPTSKENKYFLAIKTSSKPVIYPRGLHGLKNLGNTCYMNSAIQCLSNTPLLTQWFLKDIYKKDINRSNPLGLQGELAGAYAELVKSIWSTNNMTISPFAFKKIFEKFNSHFSGYEQQDSQEFLGFLLDGLHEDMNRISDKPYIEIPDFEDESKENEIASHFWEHHKARNDSIIVDLFQGQFKNIIYVYEIPCSPSDSENWTLFPIYYSLLDQADNHLCTFGYPLVLALNKSDNDPDIHKFIVNHIQRYTSKELDKEQGPLFKPRLFSSKNTYDNTFPLIRSFADISPQFQQEPSTIQSGQGMILQWAMDRAFDIFGSIPKKNSSQRAVNTDLWRKFSVLPATRSKQEILTLEDCLKEFIKEEQLSKDDLWYCPRCKVQQRATKKFDIWRLPEIMVIHLKRFSQVRIWGNKVNIYVDFPISELDMTDYVLGSTDLSLIYDLYAVDNHYGGLGGGHYTACAQNIQNKQWYNFDDTSVNKIDVSKVKTNAAYLLFYKRRRKQNIK
ncbi:hypothetical protein G6F29_011531 [Rhizopus arrhizus]|uniref:Ubiquitin carboxyl-terminal hydrolase n=1 Tax=Rhizopus oryzae TaxID=64495 RepID=A0A9P6X0D9_RHIOR|nr:hypothetical protein G6F23_008222 [Rhizopus arrhizus]KAG0758117.1 hypothetical protein G6F24_010031 [Rhizopus arrhizus]KAG0782468.1 hypothetical protein G6F21_011096 [Rhizopus arrhizus]KAG0789966.1 hypothetical protein G6F22_006550 [Rhizopus arrhizus]KAG0848765.1 hypothetical protein G6F17_011364 [Rhizopus arrhizus]